MFCALFHSSTASLDIEACPKQFAILKGEHFQAGWSVDSFGLLHSTCIPDFRLILNCENAFHTLQLCECLTGPTSKILWILADFSDRVLLLLSAQYSLDVRLHILAWFEVLFTDCFKLNVTTCQESFRTLGQFIRCTSFEGLTIVKDMYFESHEFLYMSCSLRLTLSGKNITRSNDSSNFMF